MLIVRKEDDNPTKNARKLPVIDKHFRQTHIIKTRDVMREAEEAEVVKDDTMRMISWQRRIRTATPNRE